jgi:LysR family carnitine catabolism transcriptional activator
MNVSLRQITAFVEVAQAGSFTRAATQMHLTQSALSVLVQTLEQEMGVRLLDRTTRSVVLTEAGREFLPRAQRLMSDLQDALDQSRDLSEARRGRVTIAATPLYCATLLPRAMARFAKEYPNIKIIARDDVPQGQIARMVEDGEIMLGIGPQDSIRPDVQKELLTADDLVLACPPDHPLVRRKSPARLAGLAWRDLVDSDFIAFTPENSFSRLIADSAAAASVNMRSQYVVSSFSMAMSLVDAGVGVCVVPSYARAISSKFRVRFLDLPKPGIKREIYLFRHRNRTLPAAAEALRRIIMQTV